MGYTKVMVYSEGLPGWRRKGYPVESSLKLPKVKLPNLSPRELKAKLGQVAVVDLRDRAMWSKGHIEGSINLPMDDLAEKYQTLPKDKPIVLVCHLGKLSPIAGRFLAVKGFKNVSRLDGGMMAWGRKGLPVVK